MPWSRIKTAIWFITTAMKYSPAASAAMTLSAQQYTDNLAEAHFLRLTDNKHRRLLTATDFLSPLVSCAVQYFLQAGTTTVTYLDTNNYQNGYSPIPATSEYAPGENQTVLSGDEATIAHKQLSRVAIGPV